MYIEGKSNKKLEVTINSSKSNTVMYLGVFQIIIGLAIGIFGLMASGSSRYVGARGDDLRYGMLLIVVVIVIAGGGSIINALSMKAVKFIVYEDGVYGTSMVLNPILGILTKTLNYDISFSDITGFRYEQGVFLLQAKGGEYSFPFSKEDTNIIMELLKQEVA